MESFLHNSQSNLLLPLIYTKPNLAMQFMIIEHFRQHQLKEMHKRFETKGRMLPEGVQYINSWIDEDVNTCYQVMESDSIEKIQEWISH